MSGRRMTGVFSWLCAVLTLAVSAHAQESADQVAVESFAVRPEQLEPTPERIEQLKVPEGFSLNVFGRDLGNARMLAVDGDGTVYLTCPKDNRVLALRDPDGNGEAEDIKPALEGLDMVHGITIHGDTMYLCAPKILWRVARNGQGWGQPEVLINDLPDGGQLPNRTLGVGPDEQLYISVGSTCNACEETNPESATLLRASLDGSGRSVFSRGLRNTIGFDWHPKTKVLWGMDHGSDARGNDIPPEELNRIEEGKDYGWPYAYGKKQEDRVTNPPKTGSKAERVQQSEPAVLTYQAHSAPIGFVFYDADQFPEKYRNGAFIAFRGSWNRKPPTGYKVVFVKFDAQGKPAGFEDFVTGFLTGGGETQLGRLAGIAVAQDGALLFTDDTNGVIYRVTHKGP